MISRVYLTALGLAMGLLLSLPSSALGSLSFDTVVDVTGMPGHKACRAMQAALNESLAGGSTKSPKRRVLIKGSLGTAEDPVDFSMFHNAGAKGAGGKAWPYSVCHAFWPITNSKKGEGVIDGYPDPLFAHVLNKSKIQKSTEPDLIEFKDPICKNFSLNEKQALIASGAGAGQMRQITKCESEYQARLDGDWATPPDSTSVVHIATWRKRQNAAMNLHVVYDLDVYYRNDENQKKGEFGVFTDVGLHCYFHGSSRAGKENLICPSQIGSGLHRSGEVRIVEYGQRDNGQECAPTWPVQDQLLNRDYAVVWQALGPGLVKGSDTTSLYIFGDGDRDNVGVLLFQTWTKDFQRWRIRGIGTGLWVAGSLNNTLYDGYIAQNKFGVVIGSNEDWGTGWPRWNQCFTKNCEPDKKASTAISFRGGVVEGNTCGNFVMYGGYHGEVDRTFIEPGYKGSSKYKGHSVLVGAGVCDSSTQLSPRQKADRAGFTCGDDQDCGGVCEVNANAKRDYSFAWDAALVSNRADPRWHAFMLGKGTQAKYLKTSSPAARHIRVTGNGFGGETNHGEKDFYFFPSKGAAVGMDTSGANGKQASRLLPAYDAYVSMPFRDLSANISEPRTQKYSLGTLLRRSTCTEVLMSTHGSNRQPEGRWNLFYGKNQFKGGARINKRAEKIPGSQTVLKLKVSDLEQPYISAQSQVWIDIESLPTGVKNMEITMRCWEN
ncbi:MAG: hypothetical protein CL917_19450 [Deltaproteobacteria bacterium]|nr:hypothetical protein [Deltaproteobacteria bacterium]